MKNKINRKNLPLTFIIISLIGLTIGIIIQYKTLLVISLIGLTAAKIIEHKKYRKRALLQSIQEKYLNQAKYLISDLLKERRIDLELTGITRDNLIEDSAVIEVYNQNISQIKSKLKHLNEVSIKKRGFEIRQEEWIVIFSSLSLNELFPYGSISQDMIGYNLTDNNNLRINFTLENAKYMHCGNYPTYAFLLFDKILKNKNLETTIPCERVFLKGSMFNHEWLVMGEGDMVLSVDPTYNIYGIISKEGMSQPQGNAVNDFVYVENKNNNYHSENIFHRDMNYFQEHIIALTGGAPKNFISYRKIESNNSKNTYIKSSLNYRKYYKNNLEFTNECERKIDISKSRYRSELESVVKNQI